MQWGSWKAGHEHDGTIKIASGKNTGLKTAGPENIWQLLTCSEATGCKFAML